MTLKDGKNQRTKQTRTDASYVNYGYDNYGQVQTALGYTSGGTPITSEQYGYAYDAAWNLLRLTNNGAVTTRSYNSLNQLPSPPYGDYTYDANGNLTAVGSRSFTYDDENQLVSVADTMYQKTAFTYDAKGRLRIRQEYSWVNSMWSLTDTINYVYDGMLAIQMRGATISRYTRGLDLSLSLQGAGGIGGLLAQSTPAHSYYHSDGNGNITYLMKADQSLGASYRYDDAYGNVVTTSGTLSNPFRFSSKEWLPRISAYYFGYRFYL